MRRIGIQLLCSALMSVGLFGCGRSPQTTFYTLSPLVTEATAIRPAAPTLAVASVTLPELVDRPQLVVPDKGATVVILETHRWAEPLKAAIPRLLAENLSRLIGADQVASWPQHAATSAEYRLFVDLQRFEVVGNSVVVDAFWQLRSTKEDTTPLSGRAKITESLAAAGNEAIVDGYNRALAALSREIAQPLRRLPSKP